MSINSSYLNPDSSGAPYGSNSSNGSADSYGAGTETGAYGAGAANASDSYSFSGGYSSYDEPASPLSSASAASATGASETGTGTTAASTTGTGTTAASASATSASSAAYNSTGAYSTDAYESTGSSNSTEDAVWRGQSSKEPAELKRPRVSTLIASLIMLAAAAILGALAMGVHFSWTAVGASTLGTIGLVLIVSAFFASRNKSHT